MPKDSVKYNKTSNKFKELKIKLRVLGRRRKPWKNQLKHEILLIQTLIDLCIVTLDFLDCPQKRNWDRLRGISFWDNHLSSSFFDRIILRFRSSNNFWTRLNVLNNICFWSNFFFHSLRSRFLDFWSRKTKLGIY